MVTDNKSFAAATAATLQALTLNSIDHIDQIARALADMAPEPIGEWMRSLNFPPEKWIVVLPAKLESEVEGPITWPSYVLFSKEVDTPVFLVKAPASSLKTRHEE